mgnify:CR=1 FL=1
MYAKLLSMSVGVIMSGINTYSGKVVIARRINNSKNREELILLNKLTWFALIVFLCLKKPIAAVKLFKAKEQPLEVMPAMKWTAQTNTFFVFLLAIALGLSLLI